MGTNYYIRNRNGIKEELIHIGKRSNDEFLWAIEKEELIKIFKETPGLVIINDDGFMYDLLTFISLVTKMTDNKEFVGKEFC